MIRRGFRFPFFVRKGMRGQSSIETVLALMFGIVPLTFGLFAFSELAWTYHALVTLTRQGAKIRKSPSA